jgi:hypothetical protein
MPYKTRKLKSGRVRVSGPSGVHAKASTPENAAAQVRLLRAVEHGWTPTGAKKAKNKKASKKKSPKRRTNPGYVMAR